MKYLVYVFLLCFVKSAIPKYTEIKKDEILTFKLENQNSNFYAYLQCNNDYEPEENILTHEHFISLDKNIKFKSHIFPNRTTFPDEAEFNKSSNYSGTYYVDIDKDILLGSYNNCKKGEINDRIYFVFYYNE